MNATKIATRTLPATRQEVPASVTIGKAKRTKVYSGMYEYVIEVKVDGKRIGDAVDEGNGGGIWMRHDSAEGRAAEERVQEEYREMLGREKGQHSYESLFNTLVEEWETTRDLNRGLAKKTPCLKGLDSLRVKVNEGWGEYETTEYLTLSAPLATLRADRDKVIAQTGITHVWDGKEWTAL